MASKTYKRFHTSHEFWDIFGARKASRRKKLGYYEIENIGNPCILTLAVNQKEYLEMFKDHLMNKKHKGIKKRSTGMGYSNYLERIKPLATFEKLPAEYKELSKFYIVKGEMIKKNGTKKLNFLS